MEFDIMAKNNVSASVIINFETQEVKIKQFTDHPIDRPFLKDDDKVTFKDMMDFFEYRCFPKTRANCDQLLEDLGLRYYNPIAIVKKTHGIQFDDFTWVRFKGECIDYATIKIRD